MKIVQFHLYEDPKIHRFIETETRTGVSRGWGEGQEVE